MASSQRPSRRRSARSVFDDDDEPPAKRSKMDDGNEAGREAKQVNGHIKGAAGGKKKQCKRSLRCEIFSGLDLLRKTHFQAQEFRQSAKDLANTSLAYDEEDNGFMFKRARAKQPEPKPPIESEQPPATAKAPERAPSKRKRKSFSSPLASEVKTVQQPRRSKRLSGERAPDPSTPAQLKIKRRETIAPKTATAKEASESPQLVGGGLQVEKNRNGTKIALPFADTPVQNRNKQMREKAANKQKNRRSSSGIRGRRASSLLDSGTSNGTFNQLQSHPAGNNLHDANTRVKRTPVRRALSVDSGAAFISILPSSSRSAFTLLKEEVEANILDLSALPHADVDTRDFYKHIDQNLPEPHRMRHLLTWCSARALPEKVPGASRDANETLAVDAGSFGSLSVLRLSWNADPNVARHIQEELLKDFNSKPEMSEWFNREETASTVLVKKPNPRNIQNAAKLQELEQEIARLQGEKASWEKIVSSASSSTPIAPSEANISSIDRALLDDPSQAAILDTLKSSESLPASIATRLQKITSDLEPQIDAFADGIHRIGQYRISAERVANRILSSAAQKFERRDQAAKEAAGTAGVGAREVLSALASVLNRQER